MQCCRNDPNLRGTMEAIAEDSMLLMRNPKVAFTFRELFDHYCDRKCMKYDAKS